MTANDQMSQLVSQFNLVENGKVGDYYKLHSTWCVTKNGASKIAKAIGMTYDLPREIITGVSVAFMSTFRASDGRECHQVGSCRFDGTKLTPERTHAFEMAWKRLHVRAVLELVAAGAGIYGADEMSTAWHADGNASTPATAQPAVAQQPTVAPVQAVAQPTPVSAPANAPVATPAPAPAQQPATNVDGTTNWQADPRFTQASMAQGWFATAIDLPKEWNQAMGKFTELTRLERGAWEQLILDHCGKFEGKNGWWKPSDKYPKFDDVVFATTTFNDVTKSKAGFAMNILKNFRDEVLGSIESLGQTAISVPDAFGVLQNYTIIPANAESETAIAPATQEVAQELATAFDSDVPF